MSVATEIIWKLPNILLRYHRQVSHGPACYVAPHHQTPSDIRSTHRRHCSSNTLAKSAYAKSEFDFLQVLIVRRTYFDSNIEYVAVQVDLARSSALVDGSVLSGGLESTRDTEFDSGLRDQSLNGQ